MNAVPKPRPSLLSKREAKAAVNAEDRAENAKVKHRSGGQCEVIDVVLYRRDERQLHTAPQYARRCRLRASQYHHLISGIGRRNVGDSIKAEHKLHVCDRCHEDIHGHVLKPTNESERYDAATVRFERLK